MEPPGTLKKELPAPLLIKPTAKHGGSSPLSSVAETATGCTGLAVGCQPQVPLCQR